METKYNNQITVAWYGAPTTNQAIQQIMAYNVPLPSPLTQSVLCQYYIGRWGWEEFDRATMEGFAVAKAQPDIVQVVHDFTASAQMPRDTILRFAALAKDPNTPNNVRRVLILAQDPMIEAQFHLYNKLFARGAGYFAVNIVVSRDELHQALMNSGMMNAAPQQY